MVPASEASARRARRNVVLTAAIAGLGGLLFGYDTGVIAGALLFIKTDFGLGSFAQGLVVAAVPIGAVAGAAISGPAADSYGRRLMILLSALVFSIGALGSAAAPDLGVLVVARVVIGVAIGLASAAAPVYISEVAPPESRGRLVSFFQLAVTLGILVAYLVSLAFDGIEGWRWMLGLGCVPALALGIGMLRMPQSPRWLVMHGDRYAARATLAKIRVDDPDTIDRELEEIEESVEEEHPGSWRELLEPAVKAALVVGVGLAIMQQITGINTVIYYAPSLLKGAGLGNSAALLANVVIGVVNVGMTIVAIWLLDRTGRRPLLLCGTAGMAVGMLITAFAFFGGTQLTGWMAYVGIAGLIVYTGSFAVGLGPVFWLMIAEIYPLRIRGQAMSVATIANWGANFVVTISFLTLLGAITPKGVFFLFAFLTLVALAYFAKRVPETKGRSLQEIERDLGAQMDREGALEASATH